MTENISHTLAEKLIRQELDRGCSIVIMILADYFGAQQNYLAIEVEITNQTIVAYTETDLILDGRSIPWFAVLQVGGSVTSETFILHLVIDENSQINETKTLADVAKTVTIAISQINARALGNLFGGFAMEGGEA